MKESSACLVLSTKRQEEGWRCSWRIWSELQSLIATVTATDVVYALKRQDKEETRNLHTPGPFQGHLSNIIKLLYYNKHSYPRMIIMFKYVCFISKTNEFNFSSSHVGWNLSQMNLYLPYFGCFECFLKINRALKKVCGLYEKKKQWFGLPWVREEATRSSTAPSPRSARSSSFSTLEICLRCVRH